MKTKVITVTDSDDEKIKAAAKVLDEGGLVAFPTETVYGIGCAAEKKAIARLNEIKGRTAGKRYTLHISEPSKLGDYVPVIPIRARKLVQSAWPGPLTAVFELTERLLESQRNILDSDTFDILYQEGTIGLRCPDNLIAQKLLGFTTKAIVAPSANLSGLEPAINTHQVISQFDGKIDMILDGTNSSCKYMQSSTVVKITKKKLTTLREGAYAKKDIKKMSLIKILFVCTGNTCRSPMAAAFCRKFISEKYDCDIDEIEEIGYKISSAGVMGIEGIPASNEVIAICSGKGIDARSHQSRVLSCDEVEESDYIFAMSKSHRDEILQLCPDAAQKCMLLDSSGDIGDPIGGGEEVYCRCALQIERALENRMDEILI